MGNSARKIEEGETKAWSIEKLGEGDEFAWSAFLRDFDPLIKSVPAWSKWRFAEPTQKDVCQKIRTELQRAIPTFKGDSSIEYFIKRIAIRRCIDQVRVQARENERYTSMMVQNPSGEWTEMDPPNLNDDPIMLVLQTERARHLNTLVQSLEAFCAEVISKYYLEGLKYQEISDQLGVSINTVSSRISRCMAKLRILVENSPFFGEETG